MSDVLNKYGAFVNPLVSEILYSLGAETLFERAENHIMTGFNSIVEEKKVIDLTCGYGSLMFGHNNPEIIEEACRFFQDRKPIHVQFSAKKYTAELAETMATICKDITGIDVIVRFANSGTEAVDLAIKHCEFKRVLKIQDMQKSLEQRLLQLTKRDDQPEIKIPGSIFSDTELREQIFDENLTIEQFHGYLTRLNAKALQARPIIFALKQGFHGKSIGACQLTHNGLYRKAFMYLGINAIFIDPENLFEIETIISNLSETLYDFRINNGVISLERKQFPLYTAVIAEPIQGEGGIREIDPLALKELKSICEKNEIPLIFDEIQSGLGRSGKFFASQDSGVNAEIYLLGKSLGGGLTKISAVLIKKDIYEKSFGLIHTSTFAEDEFSSAIGLKVLDMLKRDNWAALDEISRKGEKLKRGLLEISQEYPGVIKEVRGKGLLIGVEFESFEKADSAVLRNIQYWKNVGYLLFSYMQESEGIRALPTASAPSTLRLEPGVTISDVEINDTISAFRRLCKILYNQDGYLLIRHMCNTNRKCVSENEIVNFKTGEYTEKYNNANTNSPIRKIGFVAHAIGVDELERVAPELQRLSSEERWEMYNRRSVYSVNAPGIPLKIKPLPAF